MSGSRRFSPELLQKIKGAISIADVIGEHVVLRKSGANFVGLCPFHSERTPSFSVSESKQLYHCYGCKKGGDLLSFVMEIHGLDFAEAIEELADRARIPLPENLRGGASEGSDPEAQRRRDEARKKLETAYRLNRFVAAYYHQMLGQMSGAGQYFRSRGVGEELLRSFYLGVAPPAWDSLSVHLTAKKAPLSLAAELGLIRPSTRNSLSSNGAGAGTGYFDLFRNRAIFPILDLRGRVAGFGGRALPGGDENPKYLNSPESPLFQKSKLAFGLYQAQKHIREMDQVILVEGYFDVLALHSMGFQNVVASCGTALSSEHLFLFKKFASRITVLFDGDQAGITATDRAMEVGLSHGIVVQGAAMPADLDPDEVLFDQSTGLPKSGGKERMEEILKTSQPLIDVRIEEAIRFAQEGPEARTRALKKMGAWLAKFADPVGKEVRMQHIQSRLGVSRNLVLQAMGETSAQGGGGSLSAPMVSSSSSIVRQAIPSASNPSNRNMSHRNMRAKEPSLNRVEKILLSGLTQGGKMTQGFKDAGSKLPPNWTLGDLFDSVSARDFISSLLTDGTRFEKFCQQPGSFIEEGVDPQVRLILTEALVGGKALPSEEDFQGALDRAIARSWARFSQRIKAALSEAEAKKDAGLQSQLMKEYLDVQRKMKEFISFYDEA